jgi:hypothetical protein
MNPANCLQDDQIAFKKKSNSSNFGELLVIFPADEHFFRFLSQIISEC